MNDRTVAQMFEQARRLESDARRENRTALGDFYVTESEAEILNWSHGQTFFGVKLNVIKDGGAAMPSDMPHAGPPQMFGDSMGSANQQQEVGEQLTPYESLRALSQAMQGDPSYAWTWQCNLAMMAVDAGASHIEANIGAATFIGRVFGVKVSEFPEYQAIVGGVERSTLRTADGREVDVVISGGKR